MENVLWRLLEINYRLDYDAGERSDHLSIALLAGGLSKVTAKSDASNGGSRSPRGAKCNELCRVGSQYEVLLSFEFAQRVG
jgi:hypothetical protein